MSARKYCVLALFLFITPLWAQSLEKPGRVLLKKGEPAPYEGMLFDFERSKKLVEDLKDRERLIERVALLEEQGRILKQLLEKEKELSVLWNKEMIRYQEYWTSSQKRVVESLEIAQKYRQERGSPLDKMLKIVLPVIGVVKLFQ